MELIGYYLLFAFSISLAACYIWFWPALQEAKEAKVHNILVNSPVLSITVYILVSAFAAPLLIVPMLSTKLGNKFGGALRAEIFKPDQ